MVFVVHGDQKIQLLTSFFFFTTQKSVVYLVAFVIKSAWLVYIVASKWNKLGLRYFT